MAAGLGLPHAATAASVGHHSTKPKPGSYASPTTSPSQITFTVVASGKRVDQIAGNAAVSATCSLTVKSVGNGYKPAAINKSGHFTQITGPSSYPMVEGKPTVTVKGHFTSAKAAAGTVSIVFKGKLHSCDATQHWTAKHTK